MSSKTPFTDLVRRAFKQQGYSIASFVDESKEHYGRPISANTCYQVFKHGRLPTANVRDTITLLLDLHEGIALDAYKAQQQRSKPRVKVLVKKVGPKLSNRENKVLNGYRAAPPVVKRCIDYLTGV